MHLNSIKPAAGAKCAKRRVGRGIGSGLGKTCGSGHKGQRSRAGANKQRRGFEGGQMPHQRRLPKFGFNSLISRYTAEVRLSELQKMAAEVVDLTSLKAENVVAKHIRHVKVILSGTLDKAITLRGIKATKGAAAAIAKVGGKVE